ncbi:protein lethal(2)essential for life [Bombus fervidus]|uniref:protein lethal(2)essential for life n=1 Tax=Bombus fervidus TaxID=203811 RepID=UPI003AB1AD54
MSLEQLFYPNWWENVERAHLDQNLPLGINPEIPIPKIMCMYVCKSPMKYYRPWDELLRKGEGGVSTVLANGDKFRVDLDVQQFAPEEINVKVVDRFVTVEASHEEREDEHGWISRQFTRKYIIPEQCDIDQVSSKLSSDGILSIIVPRKQKLTSDSGRVIKIERTGKLSVCDMQKEKNEENKDKEEEAQEN